MPNRETKTISYIGRFYNFGHLRDALPHRNYTSFSKVPTKSPPGFHRDVNVLCSGPTESFYYFVFCETLNTRILIILTKARVSSEIKDKS